MKSICEINDLIDKGAVGKQLQTLPANTDLHTLGQGAYLGNAGMVTNSPDATKNYMYHVYKRGSGTTVIQAVDVYTGEAKTLTEHGGSWGASWLDPFAVDLSDYYKKTEADAKTLEQIHTTRSTKDEDGTLRTRLSGTVLYITNNGHVP